MNFITNTLVTLLLPVISGALAFAVTQAMKRLWGQLDEQSPEVKQAVALAWSFLFAMLAKAVDAPICADGAAFCEPPAVLWQTVVSYAVSLTIHGAKKRKG